MVIVWKESRQIVSSTLSCEVCMNKHYIMYLFCLGSMELHLYRMDELRSVYTCIQLSTILQLCGKRLSWKEMMQIYVAILHNLKLSPSPCAGATVVV